MRDTPTASSAWYLHASLRPQQCHNTFCRGLVGPDTHCHYGGNVVLMNANLNASSNHLPQQRCSLDYVDGIMYLQELLMQCMQSSVLSANLLTSTVNLSACSNERRIVLHGRARSHSCNACFSPHLSAALLVTGSCHSFVACCKCHRCDA